MKQDIKIPYYTNCYGLSDLPCVDLLLAAAAGHFSPENYFHYAFFEAIRSNWMIHQKRAWLEDKQEKLGLFGIGIKAIEIRTIEEFHKTIQKHLDSGEIVLLPLKLNLLFYTWAYGENVPLDHFVLVSGYDTDKKVYTIRDSDINVEALRPMIQGNPIYKLNVPLELLGDIWEKSNVCFRGNPRYEDKLYTVYDEGADSHSIDYASLLRELLSCEPETGGLVTYIQQFNNQLDTRMDFEKCRRAYHGAAHVIVDYVERFCFDENAKVKKDFQNFAKVFVRNRYKQLSVLHANYLRHKSLELSQIASMCHVNKRADRQLFNFIWAGLQEKSADNLSLIDYTSLATVSADSVCIPPDRPQDEYKYCAQNVLTGAFEGWRSDKNTAEHWISLVFPTAIQICKIIVLHNASALTQDYTISVRDTNNIWHKIVVRNNNREVRDTVKVDGINTFEIKIDVTVPDLNDYYAHIKKIEIWGK